MITFNFGDPANTFSVTRVFKSTEEIPFDNEKVAALVDLLDYEFKQFSGRMASMLATI